MARTAERILDGERPCDLPIETLSAHELVVNLSVARKLGVIVPPDIIRRATQVIEHVIDVDHRWVAAQETEPAARAERA
jgi:putative ABC transport system substrate-binding protein